MGSGRDLGSRARSAQPLSQVTRLKSPRTVLRFRSLPLDLVTARHRHPLPNRFLFLLRVMTAATTVPAAERITRPLRRLAVSSTTTCAVPAKAYGTCMVANYQDARKDMCAAEFVAFKNCVQAAVRARVPVKSQLWRLTVVSYR